MKRSIHIRLAWLMPLLITLISLLSVLGTYEIMHYASRENVDARIVLLIFASVLVVASVATGIFLSRKILRPLEVFMKRASKLPVVRHRADADLEPGRDETERLSAIFRHVADILGEVEARELFPSIIGKSEAMRSVMAQVRKVARTGSSVLILGESGTGKELVAHSIFEHSTRQDKPFVRLNCAAIPDGLLESELFGHEKGAFTGAHARKPGKFELAHGGTIFLDEVGDLPAETQAKLLRVLQDGEYERVGGTATLKTDVRVVAATNKDLAKMVSRGEFREDLFYRLNVFPIVLPPLRIRREDVPLLVEHFLSLGGHDVTIEPAVMELLIQHGWPGNVRELANVVERAAIIADDTIRTEHLPSEFAEALPAASGGGSVALPLEEGIDAYLAEAEKRIIQRALRETGGVQVQAARLLGIKDRSLWHRIKKYSIDVSETRGSYKQ